MALPAEIPCAVQGEIGKRGVIDVLRHGIKHGPHEVDAVLRHAVARQYQGRGAVRGEPFSVTRQLRYSRDDTASALDLALFINGLPIATFELKNSLTKQTVEDAIEQYKRDRDPREKLFEFGRCVAHFAVDDAEVRFCTDLRARPRGSCRLTRAGTTAPAIRPTRTGSRRTSSGSTSLRPGPDGHPGELRADRAIKNRKTGKVRRDQIFPRFHQLDVVRRLLADAAEHGAGQRYLIQHSAGSGKSNSIAWLAHQLVGLLRDGHRSSTRSSS